MIFGRIWELAQIPSPVEVWFHPHFQVYPRCLTSKITFHNMITLTILLSLNKENLEHFIINFILTPKKKKFLMYLVHSFNNFTHV